VTGRVQVSSLFYSFFLFSEKTALFLLILALSCVLNLRTYSLPI
jgi:hypothetical protein